MGKKDNKEVKKFLQNLYSTVDEIYIFLNPANKVYQTILKKTVTPFSINTISTQTKKVKDILSNSYITISPDLYNESFFKTLRSFLATDLSFLIEISNSYLNKLTTYFSKEIFNKKNWLENNPVTLFSASLVLLQSYYRSLKNLVNKYFDSGFKIHTELEIVDDNSPIWNITDMQYKEFPSDILKLKEYTEDILQNTTVSYRDNMIFKLQISEFIKNCIRHGNKFDKSKKVKIWYNIDEDSATFIFEDEGEGFKDLEKWNEFNKKRLEYLSKEDILNALKYASFKTENSSENDGGNFLFSALEYWDSGVIFNNKRNKIYVKKYFY